MMWAVLLVCFEADPRICLTKPFEVEAATLGECLGEAQAIRARWDDADWQVFGHWCLRPQVGS